MSINQIITELELHIGCTEDALNNIVSDVRKCTISDMNSYKQLMLKINYLKLAIANLEQLS